MILINFYGWLELLKVRISEEMIVFIFCLNFVGEHPKDIREQDYFTETGEFRVDKSGSPILLNCLMYKLCYYRFGELQTDYRSPPG
jgi:hypothetical protein